MSLKDYIKTGSMVAKLIPIEGLTDKQKKIVTLLQGLSNSLIKEIVSQKELTNAERGYLKINSDEVNTKQIINTVVESLMSQIGEKSIEIKINEKSIEKKITTDPRLLQRILVNLLKNAIEASSKNDKIELGCSDSEFESGKEAVTFWVNNQKEMTKEVKHQVFQRSFSTKGTGRGIGLYSVQLLTREYLSGNSWFESENENGTTFYIKIPIKSIN